ncbi:hypothetical protein Kpol_1004p29 [Vanderwaltozyma polyspora DSM 70294]|uniref:Eukaryotic translation initiation factor 3 subunit G N-terminal domain-containing protein n=1 Tax=Vanderwaltozyma polyspora (strain ATCC 22028 / DSM 70294 / BCRC 21397 / CBS 2163 / NBRC 10782 / NRRL Y-8283 / UCD 57-17) TaxID=436907 RepID=A7TJ86_VANPO|nr:uncharacterized protein Kpol_1004p29 [Vanderwaltozyma polyspora DSM 70294]EDO17655.1 hypothetical protein Kpol_1004p29 [Vanderwaltozyma polyspora DSM 70294]
MSVIAGSEVITAADGTKTLITYVIEGNERYKISQNFKEINVLERVDPVVDARKKWAKYGAEANSPPGPGYDTTNPGENVTFILSKNWRELTEIEEANRLKKNPKVYISCRACSQNHYTFKCPTLNKNASQN